MSDPQKIFDALLVLEYQSGKKEALTLLVKRWHEKLCNQAFWYTKNRDTAKDIAQDSWGVVIRKLPQLSDPNKFGSWAMTITTRKAIDWRRKRKRETNQLKQQYESSRTLDRHSNLVAANDRILILRKAILTLPDLQQQILNLFYLQEFSIKQIGEILEISTGTVKSRLFTAREKLKVILKNRNDEK